MYTEVRELLIELVRGCQYKGKFLLSSGGEAEEYYDLAPLFLNSWTLWLICRELRKLLSNIDYNLVACYELCPVPLLGAFVVSSPNVIRGMVVRKHPKGHGINKLVEGLNPPGNVAVLEDVTSTGKSVGTAVEALEELGHKIVVVATILNREEGCNERLKDYDFKWLLTKKELED